MKYDTAWVQSVQTPPQDGTNRIQCSHAQGRGLGISKPLFPGKILLLYHSVDPTDSQTDTEQGQSVLI